MDHIEVAEKDLAFIESTLGRSVPCKAYEAATGVAGDRTGLCECGHGYLWHVVHVSGAYGCHGATPSDGTGLMPAWEDRVCTCTGWQRADDEPRTP